MQNHSSEGKKLIEIREEHRGFGNSRMAQVATCTVHVDRYPARVATCTNQADHATVGGGAVHPIEFTVTKGIRHCA